MNSGKVCSNVTLMPLKKDFPSRVKDGDPKWCLNNINAKCRLVFCISVRLALNRDTSDIRTSDSYFIFQAKTKKQDTDSHSFLR